MIVQLEKVKSIVVCKDREFKRKAIQLLNSAAFTGEKFDACDLGEMDTALYNQKGVRNLVIWHNDISPNLKLNEFLQQIADIYKKHQKLDLKVLIYSESEETNEALKLKEISGKFPMFNIRPIPVNKKDFMHTFHKANIFESIKDRKTITPPPSNKTKEPANTSSGPDIFILEASAHVKETIQMLNAVLADPTKVDQVYDIGQRFNGVFGTFAHVRGKPGFHQLEKLSRYIDSICKTYENDKSKSSIQKDHLDLLLACAKNSYLYLKALRENQKVFKELDLELQNIEAKYEKHSELYRRENKKQEDIDDLINDLLDKSS